MNSENGFKTEEAALGRSEVEAATVLEPYPADKYQAVRDGRMTTADFIEDLIRHVGEEIDRTAQAT